MTTAHRLRFGPFALDLDEQRLWREEEEVEIRPKSLAVLRYLVEHRGSLVPKNELLERVWTDTNVSDTVLKVCVREVREALGEDAKTPRYIETVARRGYRFIGDVHTHTPPASDGTGAADDPFATIVGRDQEIAQLGAYLAKAEAGERQIVFVTGEAGIGKTTLIDLFLERAEVLDRMRVALGQCLERYGEGEAYLPILQAIGTLCRDPGGNRLVELLQQYAPTWLVQMPALVKDTHLEALQRKVHGTTHERMLREITEAIEAFTDDRGLVLVLEDLQWSDYSTLEFVSYLAHRRERTRLMVIGTYRPAEVALKGHPVLGIKQELHAHGQCEEIPLGPLSEAEVAEYLARRLAGHAAPVDLAPLVHRRTEGNALFMTNLVDFALEKGLLPAGDVGEAELAGSLELAIPDNLREMIQKQIEGLDPEVRAILEVATVAGRDFAAASVAAGLRSKTEPVEAHCDGLARRRHVLRPRDVEEWPDGTVSARYGFIHAFFQRVLYEQVGEARRVRLHRLIGKRKEVGYGERAEEIAAELALHFERGLEYPQAVRYHRLAGENALRRRSHREAADHIARGVELLGELPDSPERTQEELYLQSALSRALVPTQGPVSPDIERANARAWELCQRVGETPQVFAVMLSLSVSYLTQGRPREAQKMAEQLLRVAEGVDDPSLLIAARVALGNCLFWRGDLGPAREQLEQCVGVSATDRDGTISLLYAFDVRVRTLSTLSFLLCLQGYPDQSLARATEAVGLAEQESSPFDVASARTFAALVHQCRREHEAARAQATAAVEISRDHGFPLFLAAGTMLEGWALAESGQGKAGAARMREGLAAWEKCAALLLQSYLLALLADVCLKNGNADEGLRAVEEALAYVPDDDGRIAQAELYRLKGELLLLANADGDDGSRSRQGVGKRADASRAAAEACFSQAIEVAQQQQAKMWELRAATSLGRLWLAHGKKAEARRLLADTCDWFKEGSDIADLRDAKALLA